MAAVIGYLHNEAGPYKFKSEDWKKTTKPAREGTDHPELDWEIVVPRHWDRGRAAFVYLEEDGALVEVGVDVENRADGTLHVGASREGDRPAPGAGEIRFGG